jgi:flagellar basal body rod protein FlgG
MPYGMYISAAGAAAQSERMQILSNNLANVDTPGFKRELAILQARHAEAIERGDTAAGLKGIDDIGGGVRLAESMTDFAAGAVRQTGLKSDMAINGEGFFLVEKDGEQFLTRAGNFQFSSDGRLQTQQGHTVLSAEGGPVAIDPTIPSWEAFEDGSIQQLGGTKTYLALVKPQSLGDLVKVGENLFSPLAAFENLSVNQRSVKSGHLEMSSVKPASEMMELIETSRAYEANIRLIQSQDRMLESLLSRVLRT